MPDVFLYVTGEISEQVKAMMPVLGSALRKATADSLPDLSGPLDVEVRVISVIASDNATKMQTVPPFYNSSVKLLA